MLQFLAQLIRRCKPTAQRTAENGLVRDLEDEGIPRYPPFAKGLPVAPIGKILETQRSLIGKIRQALGMTQADFDKLVLPVLTRYAEFVHLMPASEAHHHRGAGGLFRHGLEVAFWTTQSSNAVMFSIEGSPLERRNNEPRWRMASCFAGLLHDVGKPLSDVMVSDRDGRASWNPYGESLFDWAARNKIDRYFLRWRDNRHKRHEKFALLTVDRLIPQPTREYLADAGPQVIESMLEAIAGVGANQAITKLVLRADRESVSRDMKEHRLNVDEYSYGVPVERYIFDALRRLVKSGKWKINVAGGKVWVLQQGVFVIWKPVQDIIDLLAQDKTPGVPRDPDTLADILIERGFAHSCAISEKGDQAVYRYWRVLPDALKAHGVTEPLLMLRLDSVDLIVTGEPPVSVKGVVVGLDAPTDVEEDIEIKDLDARATDLKDLKDLKESMVAPAASRDGGARGECITEAFLTPTRAGMQDQDIVVDEADEESNLLAAEQAASAALGGIGMDGIEMFMVVEGSEGGLASGPAEVDRENAQNTGEIDFPESRPNAQGRAGRESSLDASAVASDPKSNGGKLEAQSQKPPSAAQSASGAKRTKAKQGQSLAPTKPASSQVGPKAAKQDQASAVAAPESADEKGNGEPRGTTMTQAAGQAALSKKSLPQELPELGTRTTSAIQELMSLGYGLGVGVDPDMSFVEVDSAEPQGFGGGPGDRGVGPASVNDAQSARPDGPQLALHECLARYGPEAHKLLDRAITAVLERRTLLGEVLYFQDERLCILYPDGADQMATVDMAAVDVMNALHQAKAIVLTDGIPPRKFWNFDGIKAIVLNNEISSNARTVFNANTSEFALSEELEIVDVLVRKECQVEFQAPMVDMQKKRPSMISNSMESERIKDADHSVVDVVGCALNNEKGTEQQNDKRQVGSAESRDDTSPSEIADGSPEIIVNQLREMICKGEGRWLSSVVEKDVNGLNVDARTLELIEGEYPLLNISTVRFVMSMSGMKIKKGRIYLAKEKEAS